MINMLYQQYFSTDLVGFIVVLVVIIVVIIIIIVVVAVPEKINTQINHSSDLTSIDDKE